MLVYRKEGKARILGLAIFLVILCLPVYHNLYYADELRFFTTNKGYIVNWNAEFFQIVWTILDTLRWKVFHYLGYYPTADLPRTIEAVLFAPLGSGLLLYFLIRLPKPVRYWYLALVVVTLGPTVLYGWGYFPRFVFSNQAIALAAIPLLTRMLRDREFNS